MTDFEKANIPSSKDASEGSRERIGEASAETSAALEWTQNPGKLDLSIEELKKMRTLIENPPAPSKRLRAAMRLTRK